MGRRALPKIDPTISLDGHFLSLDEWGEGRPVASVFSTPRPMEIEVGCGKGLFLRTAAKDVPDHNFIGVEISRRYAEYSAEKLAKAGFTNAVMFYGDGEKLMRENVRDGSVEAVHVYFPDPWWKTRHRKRRVMNEGFVHRVVDVLRPGGALHFWTDVEEYFNVTLALLSRVTSFERCEVDEEGAEHDFDYRTHYERRMRKHDKPIYRSMFLKR